jgi:hypothetical protein
MIIVRIIGGLGNQMFQYALFRSLKENGKDVKMDISEFETYGRHNGYELSKVFAIEENIASNHEVELLADKNEDFMSKVRRKIFGIKKTHYFQEEFKYIPEVFNLDNVYLDGYWQSEKYFGENKDIIRNNFNFRNNLDDKNKEMVEKIINTNAVSIHVRRGDYVSNPEASKLHGGITTLDYYKKSIEAINAKVENPVFFVFSDDINWVKQNMSITNSYYIDWNKGKDSYKDMQLMSYCKHNIIANSSFSWWGAWLNNNPSKIVITPNKWFNNKSAEDVVPHNWVKINIEQFQSE